MPYLETAEHRRLIDSEARRADWKLWGPYLSERLGTHPRFKGEPLQFVAIDDDVVEPHTNELQMQIRDRVVAQLVHPPPMAVAVRWMSLSRVRMSVSVS